MDLLGRQYTPAPERSSRVATLQQLDSMQTLPDAELHILAEHAVLRVFESCTEIMSERSVSRNLWVILAGNVEQLMHSQDEADITLSMLGRGDIFGEGGLFGLRYRRTTVRTTTRSYLLQFRYADLEAYASQLQYFYAALRLRFRERLLQTTIARVPILTSLTPMERLSLASQLDDRRYGRNEQIVQAGTVGEGLYIIAEGQLTVVHNEHTIAVMQPGDLFGEMALLDNAPHEASIRTLTPVHLLLLPRSTFDYLLAQRPDIAAELQRLVDQRRRSDRTAQHITTTEQLVETGVIRGELALVRHADRCDPNCRRCESACAGRFGGARLRVGSNHVGDLDIFDVCRHCRWGAECVESCPEDAIHLAQNGYLIVTERCTGCGACVTACPYDAITQVPIYPTPSNPLTWLLQTIRRPQPTMMRANKCDACYGYDDHACVTACPTDALEWIPVQELYADKPSPTITIA